MSKEGNKRICLVPHLEGVGGMVSFQKKLAEGLVKRGVEVCFNLADKGCSAILVVGGTRDLPGLWKARRRGIPVIQRLDGMNWLHKRLPTGIRHWLRAEYGNAVLRLIRDRIATQIVYQSFFARDWWEKAYGVAPVPDKVIYNGVDLETYSPDGTHRRPGERLRLLMVEGNLAGGYELGLQSVIKLVEVLSVKYNLYIELEIVGRVSSKVQERLAGNDSSKIMWTGRVDPAHIPEIDRSAHALFSGDLNAACPNSVIEALACGLPVVAFDSGSLPELVQGNAGRIAAYGGDPWNLDPPNFDGLAQAAVEVLKEQEKFRAGARKRAIDVFGLDKMVTDYLKVLGCDPTVRSIR